MKIAGKSAREGGSITVEAAIVVPVVILSIAALIYIAILMYQQAYIQSLASRSAEMGAASWNNTLKDFETGKIDKENLDKAGLYWRMLDTGKQSKMSKVLDYINSKIEDSIVYPGSRKVDVKLNDYIVYKKLIVTIECTCKIPFGEFLKLFGIKKDYTIRAQSEVAISDPAEFIRNTDFILDTGREIELKYPQIKNIGDKSREVIENVKEKIQEFIN